VGAKKTIRVGENHIFSRKTDNKLFKLHAYNDGAGRKVRERKQRHLGFAAYIRRGFFDAFPGAAAPLML
jgi:hypothetical protein